MRRTSPELRSKLGIGLFALAFTLLLGTVASTQIGPGTPLPNASALSGQKTGSVLVYNLYSSSATDPNTGNTDLSITNTSTTAAAAVHLFFVNSVNGRAADNFIALAPKQTMSLLASDYDPGITGYMVAVAVDATSGCPINFNNLMGNAYIKLASGHAASLGAQAFSAFYGGVIAGCSNGSTSATLTFDENLTSGYNRLPRVLLVDNIPSRADGNDNLLVYNRIGGSFVQGSAAAAAGTLFGELYTDAEQVFSFMTSGNSQTRNSLSDAFPRLTPRFSAVVPAGRSAWMKFFNPTSDVGLTGAILQRNANVATNAVAYEGGHNLRALTLSSSNTLTVPVSTPNAAVDLSVGMTASSFNVGATGTYTITVNNPGTKAAIGSISIFDTLPPNLTLVSGSGTGWSCTGTNTANVACTNVNGLAGGNTNLAPLTLTVNVGAGTPPSITNTVLVSNAGDNNPANDQASLTASVTGKTNTTTAVTTSAATSTLGQSVTFTATVTGAGGTPTGTVEFFSLTPSNISTSLGTAPMSGGIATLSTASLAVGQYAINAVYSGDASYYESRSGVLQTVNAVSRFATTAALTNPTNPAVLGQTITLTATVTSGSGTPTGNVQFFDGATLLVARTLNGSGQATLTLNSLLAGARSLTVQYLGDPNFAPSTSAVFTQTVNQTDVGLTYPADSAFSDQKAGSVLIYNYYTSSVTSAATQNTDLSITNTNTATAATVRLFFVNSTNGRAADTFVSLQPNQTMSLLASDYDPGITGYIVAVAVDSVSGCPTGFNYLAGDAYVKQATGHRANLPAQGVGALFSGPLAGCSGSSAVLNFDGSSYNLLPRTLLMDNIPSRLSGNDTTLIVNRIGGSLVSGSSAATTGALFGLVYDDAENSYSFSPGAAFQLRGSLSDAFPRIVPRFSVIIPAGRSGWLKLFNPTSDVALTGAMINFNASANSVSSYNSGHNLRALTLAGPTSLTVPVSAPNATVDLSVSLAQGSFNVGTTGTYTVTVTNNGTRQANGTIEVYDTLPPNLTLASSSGTGWSCSGTNTANVACTNSNGLAGGGTSLPLLTLTVNVGAGTPPSITNTVLVNNAGDNNPANDQASLTASVTGKTTTTTAVTTSAATSTFGQLVTFTATVAGAGGTPTGTVEFFSLTPSNVSTSLGTAALSAGVATLSTASLAVGQYAINAVYSGDASYYESRGSLLQTVNAVSRIGTTATLSNPSNPSVLGQNITLTATVTSGSGTPAGTVQFFDGATSLGTRTLNVSGQATFTLNTLLAGARSLTVQYLGDPNYAPSTSAVFTQTVNQTDVGLAYTAGSENSDQKPGSVLIYNLYRSNAAASATNNTDISLTNTSTNTAVAVHLFLVRGTTGIAPDLFVTLQPNQTKSFLASDLDPGETGYIVAVAVDSATGCPIGHNFLLGDAYVKQPSGHRAALSAQTFAARFNGILPGCSGASATLNFDGASYDRLPRVLALDNLPAPADGNATQLIVNNIGGSLVFGGAASALGGFQGLLYDDAESAFAWTATGAAPQFQATVNNGFPAITPVLSSVIQAGRSGWQKLYANTNAGLTGAVLNFNPSAASLAFAFNGGANLHVLTLADPVSLVIPVYPATAAADLTIAKSHSGNFTIGTTGTYTLNVSNASGTKPAIGTVRVTDTLPGNLTLAGFSGTGWACTGVGTANVACTNSSGIPAGGSLPALTLTVNVNPVTPGAYTNTAAVTLVPALEANTANNTASDPTNIVCPSFTVDPATLPGGTAGTAYNQAVAATPSGPVYSYAVTSGALPPGLSLNSGTGALTGTPTQAGSFTFTVTATLFGVCGNSRQYTVAIACPVLSLTPTTLPDGATGAPYNQTLQTAPNGTNYTYTVTNGALPPGLSLNSSTGALTGTPQGGGSFPFTITATGWGSCTVSQTYTVLIVAICPTITVAPSSLPNPQVGTPYLQTLTATGGSGPYSFAVTSGALPGGLTLNTVTGQLSGTPAVSGNFSFTVTATGVSNCTGSANYSLAVTCPALSLAPATLTDAVVAVAYNQAVTASPAGLYAYSLSSGSLPPGFLLNSATGTITGTATTTGSYSFVIRADGLGGCFTTRAYTLQVVCPFITLSPSNSVLPGATVGTAYSQTFSASPALNYSFSIVGGALPPGLSLNLATGVLSGNPTTAGAYSFTVRVQYGTCQSSNTYSMTVTAPSNCPTITLPSLPNGKVNLTYFGNLATTTPSGNYAFSVQSGSLPPGLTLDPLFKALSGKPTTAGTYNFTLRAQLSNGCFGTRSYTVVIAP